MPLHEARCRTPLEIAVRRATPCRGTAIYVPGFVDGLDSPAVGAMIDALAEIGLTAVSFEPRGGRPGLDDPWTSR